MKYLSINKFSQRVTILTKSQIQLLKGGDGDGHIPIPIPIVTSDDIIITDVGAL